MSMLTEQLRNPIIPQAGTIFGQLFAEHDAQRKAAAAEIERLELRVEALEQLRPVWALGHTNEQTAGQAAAAALAQLWSMLGAKTQTEAVIALRGFFDRRGDEGERVARYWIDHYTNNGTCSLCGNSGRIDTRGVRSPIGILVGKLNPCICPNGQAIRKEFGE